MIIDIETILQDNPVNVESLVKWFDSIFYDVIREEGWFFSEITYNTYKGMSRSGLYKINLSLKLIDDRLKTEPRISLEKAIAYAREYGFKINNKGVLISYDPEKHIRNRHLLTGTDLGLL